MDFHDVVTGSADDGGFVGSPVAIVSLARRAASAAASGYAGRGLESAAAASTRALAAGSVLLLVLTFLLRNVLYTSFVDYRNARDRGAAGLITDKALPAELDAWARDFEEVRGETNLEDAESACR